MTRSAGRPAFHKRALPGPSVCGPVYFLIRSPFHARRGRHGPKPGRGQDCLLGGQDVLLRRAVVGPRSSQWRSPAFELPIAGHSIAATVDVVEAGLVRITKVVAAGRNSRDRADLAATILAMGACAPEVEPTSSLTRRRWRSCGSAWRWSRTDSGSGSAGDGSGAGGGSWGAPTGGSKPLAVQRVRFGRFAGLFEVFIECLVQAVEFLRYSWGPRSGQRTTDSRK